MRETAAGRRMHTPGAAPACGARSAVAASPSAQRHPAAPHPHPAADGAAVPGCAMQGCQRASSRQNYPHFCIEAGALVAQLSLKAPPDHDKEGAEQRNRDGSNRIVGQIAAAQRKKGRQRALHMGAHFFKHAK